TTAVFTAGCVLGVSGTEWVLLTGAAGSVWVCEMLNTCVEEILNLLHPGMHPKVKRIKDVAAGAVLLTCMCSVATAGIIFIPKIF
ncbi:MAG: diacylglycerol kinase family protein, partial [Dinghuibacter sp.]|nr:diacylglycerol kinase family protein [Dinghuibacter sp.]